MITPSADRTTDDLVAAAGGDREAFGRFYDATAEDVLQFFYRRTADPHTAADLTAETFAAALVSAGSYLPQRGPARAWLFGIARHQLTRYHRRRRVDERARRRLRMSAPVRVDDESLERIEQLIDAEAMRHDVRKAMHRLSPKLASAVDLRIVESLDYAEVAARLGCSESTARARVSRGLRRLATEMEASR